jgi:tetratricopeptide (TPR) repeat protein
VVILRNISAWSYLAGALNTMALIYNLQGNWATALETCEEAMGIADETGFSYAQHFSRACLAEACLNNGDLAAARSAIGAARQVPEPTNDHVALALAGVIALRQGDHSAAQAAFTDAAAACDKLLAQAAQNYGALYARGLALCGLALCPAPPDEAASRAQDAYRAARAITAAPGVLAEQQRRFDALALADTAGVLAGVRAVLAGEE